MDQVHRGRFTQQWCTHWSRTVELQMNGRDFIKSNCYLGSNLDHLSWLQQSTVIFFNLTSCQEIEPVAAMASPWESTSSSYGGQNCERFLPTHPMRLGPTVLLTYGGGDVRWRAGDSTAARLKLADGEGTYGCSGAQRRSSRCWFGARRLTVVQWRWMGGARVWSSKNLQSRWWVDPFYSMRGHRRVGDLTLTENHREMR
jgi:hypothetical protein